MALLDSNELRGILMIFTINQLAFVSCYQNWVILFSEVDWGYAEGSGVCDLFALHQLKEIQHPGVAYRIDPQLIALSGDEHLFLVVNYRMDLFLVVQFLAVYQFFILEDQTMKGIVDGIEILIE